LSNLMSQKNNLFLVNYFFMEKLVKKIFKQKSLHDICILKGINGLSNFIT